MMISEKHIWPVAVCSSVARISIFQKCSAVFADIYTFNMYTCNRDGKVAARMCPDNRTILCIVFPVEKREASKILPGFTCSDFS